MSNNQDEHRAKRARMLGGANEGDFMEYYTDSDPEDPDEDMLVPGNHVRVHTSFDDDDMEDDMDEDDMVEAKVSTIETATLGTLTVTTEIKPDYESHIDEIIEISCTYVDGTGTRNTAGSAKGRVIDPDVIEIGQWHEEMDAPSNDCMDLAHTLFDEGGKLKAQWSAQSNGPEKGTGAWSNLPGELNWEAENWTKFAIIETIEVAMAQRRGGLATFIVQAFINEAIDKQTAFVFAWPTQLNTAPDSSNAPGLDEATKKRVFEENKAKAIAFWRAQGFRRVGASHWFCYALDPSHPSRNLAKENDFDPVA